MDSLGGLNVNVWKLLWQQIKRSKTYITINDTINSHLVFCFSNCPDVASCTPVFTVLTEACSACWETFHKLTMIFSKLLEHCNTKHFLRSDRSSKDRHSLVPDIWIMYWCIFPEFALFQICWHVVFFKEQLELCVGHHPDCMLVSNRKFSVP